MSSYCVNEKTAISGPVKKLLGIRESESGYHTSVKQLDIHGLGDAVTAEGTAEVDWELAMEGRSWGVKGLDVLVRAVKIRAVATNVETGNESDWNFDWTSENAEYKVQVDAGKASFPLDIYPKSVSVSVQDRRISVEF